MYPTLGHDVPRGGAGVTQYEMANMCFMAYDDFVSDSPHFTFEELQDAFQNLYESSLKLHAKNKILKFENTILKQKMLFYQKIFQILELRVMIFNQRTLVFLLNFLLPMIELNA